MVPKAATMTMMSNPSPAYDQCIALERSKRAPHREPGKKTEAVDCGDDDHQQEEGDLGE